MKVLMRLESALHVLRSLLLSCTTWPKSPPTEEKVLDIELLRRILIFVQGFIGKSWYLCPRGEQRAGPRLRDVPLRTLPVRYYG